MKIIPIGEIMGLAHIADLSDKAPATKGIEAWKYYRYNHYQGYNHAPDIVISVDGLSASQLMTTTLSDGASQLLNVPPAKLFNESMLQDSREEPPKVIQKPCYSGSEDFDASESENENLRR